MGLLQYCNARRQSCSVSFRPALDASASIQSGGFGGGAQSITVLVLVLVACRISSRLDTLLYCQCVCCCLCGNQTSMGVVAAMYLRWQETNSTSRQTSLFSLNSQGAGKGEEHGWAVGAETEAAGVYRIRGIVTPTCRDASVLDPCHLWRHKLRLQITKTSHPRPHFKKIKIKIGEDRSRCTCSALLASPTAARTSRWPGTCQD